MPALEPAHAIGWLAREAGRAVPSGSTVLVTLSGRGDKDAAQIAERLTGETVVTGSLEAHLRARREAGHKLLVPYITGGLGDDWIEVVHALADAGADAVEIGIPFSDPVMDGVTIQEASRLALEHGATPAGIISEVGGRRLRDPARGDDLHEPGRPHGLPPVRGRPRRRRASRARSCPTSRSTSSTPWAEAADGAGVETVLLAAPTTPDDRLRAICERVARLRLRRRADGRHRRARHAGRRRRARWGERLQGGHRQAGAARPRHLQRRAGGRSERVRRRRDRRQRARRRACWRVAGPTPRTPSSPSSASRSTTRPERGRVRVIKYLGSKRRLVPVLAPHRARRPHADTALDLFTGTTRVAQAFKQRGAVVTAVDTARYSEVFAQCYVATDATAVDKDDLIDALAHLESLPGEPGYFTETFCERSRFFQPFNGARVDAIRDAIARDYAGVAAVPDPAHEPDRGRRPGRLHHRRADGLREAVGGALVPARSSFGSRSSSRATGARSAAMRSSSPARVGEFDLAYLDPPYNQHRYFTNYHVWETLVAWDAPDALRRRVQAGRRPRASDEDRVQRATRHARRAALGRARRARAGAGAVVQRRVVGRARRAPRHVRGARRGRGARLRLEALRRRADRRSTARAASASVPCRTCATVSTC